MFDNQCTVGAFAVAIQPANLTGNLVCLPPGEKTQVFFNGTDVDFVGLGRVGSFLDLAVSTTPLWMSASSKQPYLPCDGATYSTSVFPALGAILGSTFGGNGITTFGLPDFRNRLALPIDVSGQGRVTNAVSGVDGTAMGSAGGDQRMQSHTHTATVTDPGHRHAMNTGVNAGATGSAERAEVNTLGAYNSGTATTGITVANANNGTGSSQNMPPVVVFGVRFIKT